MKIIISLFMTLMVPEAHGAMNRNAETVAALYQNGGIDFSVWIGNSRLNFSSYSSSGEKGKYISIIGMELMEPFAFFTPESMPAFCRSLGFESSMPSARPVRKLTRYLRHPMAIEIINGEARFSHTMSKLADSVVCYNGQAPYFGGE